MKGVLFTEPEHPRTTPLGLNEPAVNWMVESTWPEAREARRRVNEWYASFPDESGEFGARVRSEVDQEHHAALDELLTFRLLVQKYDSLAYEEGDRGPDFRAYVDGELVLAVEVMTLFQKDAWTREWRRFGALADDLNGRLRVRGYMVDLDPVVLDRTPSLGKLARFVEVWLASLPPPGEVASRYSHGVPLPVTSYDEQGVSITVRALPLREDGPWTTDPDSRIVGSGPAIGGVVDSAYRLKGALRRKRAGRYGIKGVPYLVAVGNQDPFCSSNQWMSALYGPDNLSLRPSDPISRMLDREHHGLFGEHPDSGRARSTSLSGVVIMESFSPWDLSSLRVYLLDNPRAALRIPHDSIWFSHRFCDSDGSEWAWVPSLDSPPRRLPDAG